LSLETCEAGGLTLPSKKIERLDHGRTVVLAPTAPNPWSGTMHIIPSERVKHLNLLMTANMENIERFGQGMGELLGAVQDSQITDKGENQ